jgi:signal transduction histidine kinase
MPAPTAPKPAAPAVLLGLVLALALAILGATVFIAYSHLRDSILAQMEQRDGQILNAVALSQQFGPKAADLAQRLQDPAEQLELTLIISQVQEGVLGVRLFDARGRFIYASPFNVTDATLAQPTLETLQRLQPVSHYYEALPLSDWFLLVPSGPNDTNTAPALEVCIPIHAQGQSQLLACAELLIDAHDFAKQAALLHRQLRAQALAVFLLGALLLTAALAWTYFRLQAAGRLIEERTKCLQRANSELMLAAKTNALGAVTAHLIHGLSNPLENLQDYVAARRGDDDADSWTEAVRATQRMRLLVQEVVRVLGEGSDTDAYEITIDEMARALESKVQPITRETSARCEVTASARGRIANHPANIVLLILENLIHNALRVTPPGGTVRALIAESESGVICRVSDEGPGFPEASLKNLFAPCRSTKGGAGLGLAISKQLANHLGASLELRHTSPAGSAIELILPKELFTPRQPFASSAARDDAHD